MTSNVKRCSERAFSQTASLLPKEPDAASDESPQRDAAGERYRQPAGNATGIIINESTRPIPCGLGFVF